MDLRYDGRKRLTVLGCYQCSQRRIHCDNTHPSCAKCASRGIECSGYGVRYRFKSVASTNEPSNSAQGVLRSQEGETPRSLVELAPYVTSSTIPRQNSNPHNRNEFSLAEVSEDASTPTISGDLALGSREPLRQYLLTYCKS